VLRLEAGDAMERAPDGQEVLVLILEGTARVTVDGAVFPSVGSRSSVFEDPPAGVVLVAPGSTLHVVAVTPALLALAAAPRGSVTRTANIPATSVMRESRGNGPSRRQINNLLPPGAQAGRLIAVEAYTPGGNWSSYPPHKHDTDDPPRESQLEEVYLYRFAKPTGFALQRVYTPDGDLDETLVVRDLDLVLVPRGYHVVAAAPGYDAWYLNIMAGPERVWRFTVDPDHRWLMDWDPERPAIEGLPR